jgi:hypothetical protein
VPRSMSGPPDRGSSRFFPRIGLAGGSCDASPWKLRIRPCVLWSSVSCSSRAMRSRSCRRPPAGWPSARPLAAASAGRACRAGR